MDCIWVISSLMGVYNVLGQLFDCFIFGVNQDGIGHVHRHLVVEHHPRQKLRPKLSPSV